MKSAELCPGFTPFPVPGTLCKDAGWLVSREGLSRTTVSPLEDPEPAWGERTASLLPAAKRVRKWTQLVLSCRPPSRCHSSPGHDIWSRGKKPSRFGYPKTHEKEGQKPHLMSVNSTRSGHRCPSWRQVHMSWVLDTTFSAETGHWPHPDHCDTLAKCGEEVWRLQRLGQEPCFLLGTRAHDRWLS